MSATAAGWTRLSSSKHLSKLTPCACNIVPIAPSASKISLESRSSNFISAPLRLFDHRENRAAAPDLINHFCIRIRTLIEVVTAKRHDVIVMVGALNFIGGVQIQIGAQIQVEQMRRTLDPDI